MSKFKSSFIAFGVILVLGAAFYAYRNYEKQHAWKSKGEPQKTVEAILNERARMAEKSLETPLGKAFAAKNWALFDSLYHPEKDFYSLSEMIRAGYIENIYQKFSSVDLEKVEKTVYETLLVIDEKTLPRASLLITQFMRMPMPPAHSETKKRIEKSAVSDSTPPLLRRTFILKIVQQDSEPDATAVNEFSRALGSEEAYGYSREEWIGALDEIRSVSVREKLTKKLIATYGHLKPVAQRETLVVWSHLPKLETAKLCAAILSKIQSSIPADVESGVRALTPVLIQTTLTDKEKDTIAKKLASIPEAAKTPYLIVKTQELSPYLSAPLPKK
jgi:hypothetical protein